MTGLEWVQLITLSLSIVTLAIVTMRVRRRGNWQLWLGISINLSLTIVYYLLVWMAIDTSLLTELSAALRLETILTFLMYAVYLPTMRIAK